MLLLYTFCCDIERHSRTNLIECMKILLYSLDKHIPRYKLLCFTNFRNVLAKHIPETDNIEYREYYDKQIVKLYNNKWLNLSFNKINVYKDLYDEFNKDFCWIDLDTIICADITYINDFSNVFVENGGTSTRENVLFVNDTTITVPRNRYILGNFWKLNVSLYNELMRTLDGLVERKLLLRYDLQDLFGYYIYIERNGECKDIHILGNNTKPDNVYGLSVWNKAGHSHANESGLANLYSDNGMLKSRFYPDKTIHILSFTFKTLMRLQQLKQFKQLFIS